MRSQEAMHQRQNRIAISMFHKWVPSSPTTARPVFHLKYETLDTLEIKTQSPASTGFSEAGYCVQSGGDREETMPRIHFNLKDLFRALFVPSSLNILNTVRWSVSGTVSIPIMSPLLLRTMLCFNTHYGFQQSFLILTLANPILSTSFCPNIVAETITHKMKQLVNFQIHFRRNTAAPLPE